MAFDFADEIMRLLLDQTDKNFAKILAAKQAITSSVLTVNTRVRPGDLRGQKEDGFDAFLEELRAGADPEEDALFH